MNMKLTILARPWDPQVLTSSTGTVDAKATAPLCMGVKDRNLGFAEQTAFLSSWLNDSATHLSTHYSWRDLQSHTNHVTIT